MAACLTCEEIELRMCELLEELAASSCNGVVVQEGDTKMDYSQGLMEKNQQLAILKDLWNLKCGGAGAGDLYEFVHVPCVKPAVCVGPTCRQTTRLRTGRRYR